MGLHHFQQLGRILREVNQHVVERREEEREDRFGPEDAMVHLAREVQDDTIEVDALLLFLEEKALAVSFHVLLGVDVRNNGVSGDTKLRSIDDDHRNFGLYGFVHQRYNCMVFVDSTDDHVHGVPDQLVSARILEGLGITDNLYIGPRILALDNSLQHVYLVEADIRVSSKTVATDRCRETRSQSI